MTVAPSSLPRRSRGRRLIIALTVMAAIVAGAGYAGAGYLAYQQLSVVEPRCGQQAFATHTPADFSVVGVSLASVPDAAPYRFTDAIDVSFPSRGGDVTIRAWYAPPARSDGAVVILVHGYNACRREWNVLLPAGMLHRRGYGVLLPDLRNHGDSEIDDGRWAGGAKEYRDVLGAWDWLVAQGITPDRIGLVGMSLGAATVAIATGEEPRVAATWLDSSYARFDVAGAEYAEEKGYPGWVAGPAVPIGRLLGDAELAQRDPAGELAKLDGRPLYVVHGLADATIPPHHAVDLAVAAGLGGTAVEPWLVPGVGHTEAMLVETDRYEARLVTFFALWLGSP